MYPLDSTIDEMQKIEFLYMYVMFYCKTGEIEVYKDIYNFIDKWMLSKR